MGHFIPLSHPYTAITVSQSFLDNIYKLNGLTKLIVSDKDTFFLSRFWKELFQVSLHTSSTYNPQTDRQTEYNTSYHTGINNTPLQVVYGQPPPAHITYNHGESPLETMDRSLAAREAVIDLLKKHTLRKNKQHKLSQKYYGPFRILAKVGKVAYKLELPDNAQIHPVFHVLQLKAHRGETPLSPRNLPHCNNEGLIAVEPYAILDRRMAKKAINNPNHLIGECPKPPKDTSQRAFVGGSWSDSGEEDDEKAKDETCLAAQESIKISLGVDLEPNEWIKDSGCSKHMTGNRKLFTTYKEYNGGQICDNKCRVTFSEHDSEITKDGKVIGRGIRKKDLYVMKLGNNPKDKICLATIDENSTLWHKRLGHANMRLIQSLALKELVRNLPKLMFDQHLCDACKIGKQVHASHKAKNIVLTTRCLELLHMDLFDPSTLRSYEGNLYTLVTVDEYSRTDNDREFDNEVQFGEFCNANGITHNFSAPCTPQSNGVIHGGDLFCRDKSDKGSSLVEGLCDCSCRSHNKNSHGNEKGEKDIAPSPH
ncbi:retrovirus-related pol polyprotein from transposon TNT 1-94 [Tanacetum coccineum]